MRREIINSKSLKDQVYDYLREEIRKRKIAPGSSINMDTTSRKLGISKTPLRDALLQLEMEGFVNILPRKGIIVKRLELEDIKNIYQIIGALESSALRSAFIMLEEKHIGKMEKLNNEMEKALDENNFNLFYRKNLAFHNIFLDKCSNHELIRTVNILKKRLYDFSPPEKWIKTWEERSIECHRKIVDSIKAGDINNACILIADDHWSFEIHKKFIMEYYFQ